MAYRRSRSPLLLAVMSLALPLLCGGCPEFRDSVVDAAASATHSLVLSEAEPADAIDTAGRSVAGALIDLVFDQFRTNDSSTSRF